MVCPDPTVTGSPRTVLGSLALIITLTEGRPDERSLLLRSACRACPDSALSKVGSAAGVDESVGITAPTTDDLPQEPHCLVAPEWQVGTVVGAPSRRMRT